MSPIFKSTACAVAALIAGLIVATEASARKKSPQDTATGTHKGEYIDNLRNSREDGRLANGDSKPEPTTSTGRELTGPNTHHEEYIVPPGEKGSLKVDSVQEPVYKKKNGASAVRPEDSLPKVRSSKPSAGQPVPGVDDKSSTRPGE